MASFSIKGVLLQLKPLSGWILQNTIKLNNWWSRRLASALHWLIQWGGGGVHAICNVLLQSRWLWKAFQLDLQICVETHCNIQWAILHIFTVQNEEILRFSHTLIKWALQISWTKTACFIKASWQKDSDPPKIALGLVPIHYVFVVFTCTSNYNTCIHILIYLLPIGPNNSKAWPLELC